MLLTIVRYKYTSALHPCTQTFIRCRIKLRNVSIIHWTVLSRDKELNDDITQTGTSSER